MGTEIHIAWLVGPPETPTDELQPILSQILAEHDATGEMTCVITDDSHLQQLNRDYREKDTPTDVLSFQLLDAIHPDETTLGDIYISIDRARQQAREARWPIAHEILKLAIHGTLHLLGYDHKTDTDYRKMRAEETRYLAVASVITEEGA